MQKEPLENILKEFNELIGLDHVKKELDKLIAFARVIALRRERDIPVGAINLHMVFSGPPGTGKTEVARKVGKILKAIGLLRRGHCVEVDRAQLTSVYANSGPALMTDKVKEALDGVLFIDEAYALAGSDPLTSADRSGKEVIDTLLKLMEDHRERLVVIAAGYTNEMRRFVDSNTGLKSRFSRFIEFSSYNDEELHEIFKKMLENGHYQLTEKAENAARKHIRWMSQNADDHFGNARAVRSFFETILPIQAERIAFTDQYESMNDEELLTINKEDVELATPTNRFQKESLETILKEFNELIGLGRVKEELNKLIAFAQVIALRQERDIPVGAINLHMVFSGPPGTGKTEIARKVGKILNAIGLLRRGHCVEVDRAQLTSVYSNSGPALMTDKVKEALDGVLFIDEAYTLAGSDPLTSADRSGKEVIDTLLKLMEDHRERLVVIVAGYTNEMRRFIDSNTGLKSRFSRFIEFSSYDDEELFHIFNIMVKNGHYQLAEEAEDAARKHIRWMSQNADDQFGNARAVRSFFEAILPIQAERIAFTDQYETMTNEELLTINKEDVELATGIE